MTVRGLLLALALLASTPVEAHCYSVWHYPWKQRCWAVTEARHVTSLARATFVTGIPNQEHLKNKADAHATHATRAIALPSLARADFDGGEADEPTRAKVLLRAALEAADAQ